MQRVTSDSISKALVSEENKVSKQGKSIKDKKKELKEKSRKLKNDKKMLDLQMTEFDKLLSNKSELSKSPVNRPEQLKSQSSVTKP